MLILRNKYYSSPLIIDEDEYLEKMFTSVRKAKKFMKKLIDRDKFALPSSGTLILNGQTVDSAAHEVRKKLSHLGKEGKDAIKYYKKTDGNNYFLDNYIKYLFDPVKKNKDTILKVPKNKKLMRGLENYQKRVEDSMSPYRDRRRDTIQTALKEADFWPEL